MSTLLIANNCTRESGSFMGDQCCYLKIAHMFVQNQPDVDRIIMSVSPGNEMHFVWEKFIDDYKVELVYDTWHPGDWPNRWAAWDKWRRERCIQGRPFDHYRELSLRIHGAQRQTVICGWERGLGRRNIFEYVCAGQENMPDVFSGSDVYDVEIYHPPLTQERDVYISPHAKTQGNVTFTFDFWSSVVHKLIDAGVTVTVGYDGYFCEDLRGNPLYQKHWGDHKQWMSQVCRHRLVACGNTGTGWLAAACGAPLLTMEPPGSVMADHRYRECGLRNLVEVVDKANADYVARRLVEFCYSNDEERKQRLRISDLVQEAALYSVNPPAKLRLLAEELLSVSHLPGHMCDLGSYRGGTALLIRKLVPDKVLNLFDTWEGNPYDDPMCHHKRGEWTAVLDECMRVVVGSDGSRARDTYCWKGVFPESVRNLEHYQFCFVYVDMDCYESTRDAIAFFWPRMVKGGKMVFDDYRWLPCAGVEKAVREAFSDEQIKEFPSLYTCVMEK